MRTVVFLVLLAATLAPAHGAAAQTADDKATARRISSHLKDSGQLRNYRIGVTYHGGIASLSGTVTNSEQRDTAIRLAEQVAGVSRVVSELEYSSPSADGSARNMSGALGASERASFDGDRSGVVNAYGQQGAGYSPQAERSPRLARTTSPGARGRMHSRGNMPLPSPRGAGGYGIQQVNAQSVQQAGGFGPHGYGGPIAGGAGMGGAGMGGAVPAGFVPHAHGRGPSYENPQMPAYAWPSYASYPNYAALSYPQQYSPTAWPYIGPFYPYPQVPLAWRKVSLEWDDGWWFLDFSAHNSSH